MPGFGHRRVQDGDVDPRARYGAANAVRYLDGIADALSGIAPDDAVAFRRDRDG